MTTSFSLRPGTGRFGSSDSCPSCPLPGWAPHTYGPFCHHHSVPVPTAHGLLLPPAGLRDGLYEASRDIANTKGVKLEVFRYFTYFHPDPNTLPEIQSVSACARGPHGRGGVGREGDSLQGEGIGQYGAGMPKMWLAITHAGPGALGSYCQQYKPCRLALSLTSFRDLAGTGEHSHGVGTTMGREIPVQLLHRAPASAWKP